MAKNPWDRRGRHCPLPDSAEKIRETYRSYQLPDGTILEVTKEEFNNVVEVFRMLWNQDQKLRAQAGELPPMEPIQESVNPELLGSNIPFSPL